MSVYKLSVVLGDLLLRLSTGVRQATTAELSTEHIIIHHKNATLGIENARHIIPLNLTHAATVAYLTSDEVRALQAQNYYVERNEMRPGFFEEKAVTYESNQEPAAASPYLQAPMTCPNFTPKDISVVLPDSMLFPNSIPSDLATNKHASFVFV